MKRSKLLFKPSAHAPMVAAKRPKCLLHNQRARALPGQRVWPLVENLLLLIFKCVDYIITKKPVAVQQPAIELPQLQIAVLFFTTAGEEAAIQGRFCQF
ncbi:hypothetical protein [uncultured Dysosmobacter sp.]|uniref:hypothetical protein n=1 Tax=uncultured Dysosmobacter sp. TaxID=2591384 RepID=UPI0026031983|nr:hypothetical protein [uncultured Dysosmobacter sp.]